MPSFYFLTFGSVNLIWSMVLGILILGINVTIPIFDLIINVRKTSKNTRSIIKFGLFLQVQNYNVKQCVQRLCPIINNFKMLLLLFAHTYHIVKSIILIINKY